MRELSLFTGAGGGVLGTKLLGVEHVGYVEINEYCQRIIAQRIKDGVLDNAPIFSDIRTFISEGYADAYSGMVDIVTAGFPCQPYSTAARGANPKDTMLKYTIDVIGRVLPRFVLCENVSRRAISAAAERLQEFSYHTRAAKVSAADVGADHIRERYWLFAYTDNEGELCSGINAKMGVMPGVCPGVWRSYPNESGMDDGLACRMDRFKAIGNGQVPAVVRAAWQLLVNK